MNNKKPNKKETIDIEELLITSLFDSKIFENIDNYEGKSFEKSQAIFLS